MGPSINDEVSFSFFQSFFFIYLTLSILQHFFDLFPSNMVTSFMDSSYALVSALSCTKYMARGQRCLFLNDCRELI